MSLSPLLRVLVVVLLALQACLSALLWLIVPPTGTESTGVIALVLGADLLAFAMIVHVYRTTSIP